MQANEDQKVSSTGEVIGQTSVSIGHALKEEVHSKGTALIANALVEGAALYAEVADLDKVEAGDPNAVKIVKSNVIGSQTKQLALLYRDVLFEIQKGELLHAEGSVSQDQLQGLIDSSSQTISAAELAYHDATSDTGLNRGSAKDLVKQDHPWPIYETQLNEINTHLNQLVENKDTLTELSTKVKGVKTVIEEKINEIKNRFIDLESQAENILRSNGEKNVEAVIDLLHNTNQSLDQPGGTIAVAHNQIESVILEAPIHISPIISIDGGILEEEDLSPQFQLEQWYDIEILQHMEDAYQHIDTMTYNFRLALINISNRLEILQSGNKEFDFDEHLQPLRRFTESVPTFRTSIDNSIVEIEGMIDANLSLYPLLVKDIPFLSIGFQGSINRFKKEQNLLFGRIGYYWKSLKGKYFSIKSTVREESQLGDVEKVVRYIQGSESDRNNIHYNNFFNAKVTMVEAFWMGRSLEQKRISQVINAWNSGFQGAILFHGDRYSGKSSLGDWVSLEHFRGKTYALKPNRPIVISKRKVDISGDLIKSIRSFIDKVQYAKPMIWIDDLELWFDEDHLSDEVTAELVDIINEYGKKVFFAVSVGSWMYHRLNRAVGLDHTFQSAIELSPFTKDILKEAILLRHGASHKRLIGQDSKELSNVELDKYVSEIANRSQGNIGHALQLWVNGVKHKDERFVQIDDMMSYKFPDIITSDNGLLLSSLLIYRKLSEQKLEALLGPAYHDRYKQEVSQLVGYGVVRRSYNGTLSINDKVVPAITASLRQNRFI